MAIVKEHLGKWSQKEYVLPSYDGVMEHIKGESIMLFGWQEYKGKRFRLFYGIGIVYRVVKGEKSDLVYINFGITKHHTRRLVSCYDNHSRRQVLTLKRGQICQVYGLANYYESNQTVETEKGTKKRVRLGLYAKGILGWYVPTMLDIRKMPENDNLEKPNSREKKIQENFDEILDMFINKGEIE